MQTTMDLLDKALKQKKIPEWTRELGLSDKALYNAKYRHHMSPQITEKIAQKLGENVQHWVAVAALEKSQR